MPTPLAQTLAHIHAACFTIPRPWTAQEFHDFLENPTVFHIKHEHGFVIGATAGRHANRTAYPSRHPRTNRARAFGRELLNNFITEVKNKDGQNIVLEVAKKQHPRLAHI